jgi:hypothetical protein
MRTAREFHIAKRAMNRDHCGISWTARRVGEGFHIARWARKQRWDQLIPQTARRAAEKSHIARWAGMSS